MIELLNITKYTLIPQVYVMSILQPTEYERELTLC